VRTVCAEAYRYRWRVERVKPTTIVQLPIVNTAPAHPRGCVFTHHSPTLVGFIVVVVVVVVVDTSYDKHVIVVNILVLLSS
jgi:hypothetical protein